MTQTILITGGAGFVGSHLVERLRAMGRRVLIVDDLSTGCESNLAHLLGDDCVLLPMKVSDVIRRRPDALEYVTQVYHLAASVGVQLVVDPVMVAKGGAALIDRDAVHAMKARLIPRATLITPNLPELEHLAGHRLPDSGLMEDAAADLDDEPGEALGMALGEDHRGAPTHREADQE